jgi:Peptidase family S41
MRLFTLLFAAALLLDSGNEPARPLTERGLDNLVAFTRLLGDVRYFHPSDQAAAADWGSFAVAGVQRVEAAPDAEALARTLEDLFRPIAPTVRVFVSPNGGRQPPLPDALKKPAGGAVRRVAWRHSGITGQTPELFRSFRVDDETLHPAEPARAEQALYAAPFRGKKVRLRAMVRAELPEGNHANLWLAVRRPNGEKGFEDLGDHPFGSGPWHATEITGDVAPDAEYLAFGVALDRQGKVWIDDVALEIVGNSTGETAGDPQWAANPSFEEGEEGWQPDDWEILGPIEAAGYSLTRSAEQPYSGRWSGLLASADPKALVPDPGAPFVADLGGGVSALIPLALWADASGTLPHPGPGINPPQPDKPAGFTPSGDDRASRLAIAALAWNVFQNFYPYFDVDTPLGRPDWPAVLRTSLREAAADRDDDAFKATMYRMTAALHDGHAAASHATASQGNLADFATPALTWDWIEDRLVITWADPERALGVHPGDAVLSIDGKPAREVVEDAETRISATTPQHRRARTLPNLAVKHKDVELRLEIQPLDGSARTVTLRRMLPYFGEGSAASLREKSLPDKIAELRPGIFYVDLSRTSDDDLQGALDRLAAARGVVFDLREHPYARHFILQHLTDRPLYSEQFLVPLATRPDQQGVTWLRTHWTLPPLQPLLKGKLAFLIGARTFSAGDTFAEIVDFYKLGALVGSPTAGITGNVNLVELPGQYRLIWTGMKVLKQDGSLRHGVAIQPTIPVAPTRRGLSEGRDEVLEKAIEVVSPPLTTARERHRLHEHHPAGIPEPSSAHQQLPTRRSRTDKENIMKRVPLAVAGILLFALFAFADANPDGVKWNAEYNAGDKSVHVVIDTQGLEKTSHLSNIRLRFLVDGGQSKVQVTIKEKEVPAGTVLREAVSLNSGKVHSLTPDMLFYKVTADAGQSDPKPHQQAPTADLATR